MFIITLAFLICVSSHVQACASKTPGIADIFNDSPLDDYELDSSEITAVKNFIENVLEPNLNVHGPAVFMELFKLKPGFQQLFKKIKDVPLDELPTNTDLESHSINILKKFIKCVINNLESAEDMHECFLPVAEHHKPRNVGPRHVKVLAKALSNYLTKALGNAFSGPFKSGWEKIFGVALHSFEEANEY